MEGAIAIGGLILLVVLAVWIIIMEAKSGAIRKEALRNAQGVIDGYRRFEEARRESADLPRRERLEWMLSRVAERERPPVPQAKPRSDPATDGTRRRSGKKK